MALIKSKSLPCRMQALESEGGGLRSRKPGSLTGSVITGYSPLGLTLYLWGPQAFVMGEKGTEDFLKLIRGIQFCDSKKDFVIVFDFSQRDLKMRV